MINDFQPAAVDTAAVGVIGFGQQPYFFLRCGLRNPAVMPDVICPPLGIFDIKPFGGICTASFGRTVV